MCRISGCVTLKGLPDVGSGIIEPMTDVIDHRGLDRFGHIERAQVTFAHCRMSTADTGRGGVLLGKGIKP